MTNRCLSIKVSIIAMATMLLSLPSFSQDKALLAKADSLHQEGMLLVENERDEEAMTFFKEAAKIRKDLLGENSAEYASSLKKLGNCYYNLGEYATARDYYQQVLSIREKVFGKNHPDYFYCLYDLGDCYKELRDYAKALDCYRQSLTIEEELFGKEHYEYANLLDNIAYCYWFLRDYDKALDYYQQVLTSRDKGGKETSLYATNLSNVGLCYKAKKQYGKAIEYYQRALAIREKVLGNDNAVCESNLNIIGDCFYALGQYAKALEYYKQCLTIREMLHGKENPQYVTSLDNVGVCYWYLGNYYQALDYYQQSLLISEMVYGKGHLECASCLHNLAMCYNGLGHYTQALDYNQQALEIRKRELGENHPLYAATLNNIGVCYYHLGDYTEAIDCHQRAAAIQEKISGKENRNYAAYLNGIGVSYYALGKLAQARDVYKQVLEINEKTVRKDHPSYAGTLFNIGNCLEGLEDYNGALECYLQALEIEEKSFGKNHKDYANTLNNIANCYKYLYDYSRALEYYQQSLSIRKTVLGENHPEYATSLKNIGLCYYDLGDYSNATAFLTDYLDLSASFMTRSFPSLTESRRAMYWGRYSNFITDRLFNLSVTIDTPQMNRTAYNGALFGKGLLLNAETEMRKLILESGDDEALKLYNEVQECREKLDKLYKNPVGRKSDIEELNQEIDSRQQALMQRSKVFGDYTRNLTLKWTDVQSALGKKDIAIEFETYTRKGATCYIALTLRPGYTEPHIIKLFNSEDLIHLNSSRYYTTTDLTRLVWGNLAEELKGVQNVYFSPAGVLNSIGIEYLLDDDGKHLVSEKRNFYRLTSTRELTKEHITKKISDATLYGGIRYDVSPGSRLTGRETESEILASTADRSSLPIDGLVRGRWEFLPGTKDEVEDISKTLSMGKIHNTLLEGAEGTEESFKSLSGVEPDVIHIASHGFYWTNTEAAQARVETSSFILDDRNPASKEDKALTRSGLLFAGAQNAFEGKTIPIDVEDGILTAKDISRLDLRNTDLVVLSACQSGLGDVTGEGVFGLQRGFKKAGVQSIVMSLWEVSDEATKIIMTRFYENLAKGRSKYDSFREAQNYLRKYDGGLYDEPEYYAAFVLLDAIK